MSSLQVKPSEFNQYAAVCLSLALFANLFCKLSPGGRCAGSPFCHTLLTSRGLVAVEMDMRRMRRMRRMRLIGNFEDSVWSTAYIEILGSRRSSTLVLSLQSWQNSDLKKAQSMQLFHVFSRCDPSCCICWCFFDVFWSILHVRNSAWKKEECDVHDEVRCLQGEVVLFWKMQTRSNTWNT